MLQFRYVHSPLDPVTCITVRVHSGVRAPNAPKCLGDLAFAMHTHTPTFALHPDASIDFENVPKPAITRRHNTNLQKPGSHPSIFSSSQHQM